MAFPFGCGAGSGGHASESDAAVEGSSGDGTTARPDGEGGAHGDGGTDASADQTSEAAAVTPTVMPMGNALNAGALAVIVNADDPVSVAVGAYYQQKRKLPAANVVSVHVPAGANITSAQFATVQSAVEAALPAGIQALALSFTQPYEVDGMSITSAFAFGYDAKWTNTTGGACGVTAQNPYFDTDDPAPYTDLQMRPTMMLAGASQADVEALVDRGVAADDTHPDGGAYMVITSDAVRSVRSFEFEELAASWDPATGVNCVIQDNSDGGSSDALTGKKDVLFYFTGLASVPDIDADTYLPGAFADHLTSFGGQVPTSGQMSAVAWLKVGATASFGTVVEPCNYTEKFPDPSIAVPRYFQGATAVEAYWKSVQWPGEGLFIGDPLAAPWRSPVVTFQNGTLTIKTSALKPGAAYRLEGGPSATGPFSVVQGGISTTKYDYVTITVANAKDAFYRIVLDVDGGADAGGG
jgi:uncharacterized protein (TIGR03790 family)